MSTLTHHQSTLSDKLGPLIELAAAAWNECRDEIRYPFLHPLQITVMGQKELTLQCFSKDISNSGIGVLSNVELPLGEVLITLQGEGKVSLSGEVVWTRPLVREWYTCGIRFLDK